MTPSISRPSTASTIEDIQTRPAPLQRNTDAPELLDSTSYFAFRNHVFATFRAKVKPLSPADTKALAEEDHVFSMHAGDPFFDAVMFARASVPMTVLSVCFMGCRGLGSWSLVCLDAVFDVVAGAPRTYT
jgi:hypothetical protein